MKFISADYIFTEKQRLEQDIVIIINEYNNKIIDIKSLTEIDSVLVENYQGIITPGFINAHCHLELSSLFQKIPNTGDGLISFLNQINSNKNELKLEAMITADHTMWNNGIQAVGDIVNTCHSIAAKKNSSILYHSFVEAIGIESSCAVERLGYYKDILIEYDNNQLWSSLTWHAPYSCSFELMNAIGDYDAAGYLMSVHNQETLSESRFFYDEENTLRDFAKQFLHTNSKLAITDKNVLASWLPLINDDRKLLLVHNTFSIKSDFDVMKKMLKNITLCTCPQANLYIENKLPNYSAWIDSGLDITIGTDSLASNYGLCIWEEIKCIKEANKDIGLVTLITWATINGAKYYEWEDSIGSIAIGKSPGLVNIVLDNLENIKHSKAIRIL